VVYSYIFACNPKKLFKRSKDKTPMGRRSLNSFFVLSLVSLSTTAALWQEARNCLKYCDDHITCCEKKSLKYDTQDTATSIIPQLIYASDGRYGKRIGEEKPKISSAVDIDPQEPPTLNQRHKRSMGAKELGKENEQIYRYLKVAKRSSPQSMSFDRSKDADMMMRLGKRNADDFYRLLELNKRQTASMMRMGKRSIDTDTAESADRIYRSLMKKRQTASMMRMGKRGGIGDMMRMGKRDLSAFYGDDRFGKRGSSSFNGDMMRMGRSDFAFNDDMRFGKRGYSSFNGDMMRMGKRYMDDDVRFGKRGSSSFNGDMMRMGKRNFAFNDDMRFGKRELSSFNGDMMRMGKREGQDLYDSDLRFGKRDWNEGYPVNSEELMRSGRDPWIIMDEDIYDSYQKRSNPGLGIWKKNQDANLMRIGKRSAFNDDMMRMGKRDWDKRFMNDDMRFGK